MRFLGRSHAALAMPITNQDYIDEDDVGFVDVQMFQPHIISSPHGNLTPMDDIDEDPDEENVEHPLRTDSPCVTVDSPMDDVDGDSDQEDDVAKPVRTRSPDFTLYARMAEVDDDYDEEYNVVQPLKTAWPDLADNAPMDDVDDDSDAEGACARHVNV